eukprot:5125396-Pyramimonas_sp.AAC.1
MGWNWYDLHNEENTTFPVMFYGTQRSIPGAPKPKRDERPLNARPVLGCQHATVQGEVLRTPTKG